jgi:hypothetical protein
VQCEKSLWGTFKYLKYGQHLHMSAKKAEQQATGYSAVCIKKGGAIQAADKSSGLVIESQWLDAYMTFQKWESAIYHQMFLYQWRLNHQRFQRYCSVVDRGLGIGI